MSRKVPEAVKNELTPKAESSEKKDLSSFKVKDEFFDKIKSYMVKGKKGEQKEIDADWRNLNIGGLQMVVFKGKPITKVQYAAFDKSAKDYWLEGIK